MNEQNLHLALTEVVTALKRLTMTVFPCPDEALQAKIDKNAHTDLVVSIKAIEALLSKKTNFDFPRGQYEL